MLQQTRRKNIKTLTAVIVLFIVCFGLNQMIRAQTTVFTYQGKLTDGGSPPTAQYDFTFRLFNAVAGGTQVGADVIANDVQVTAGVFMVNLDFGAAAFTSGAERFLQISVRPGANTGAFTPLSPLQPLTSSPFAIRTLSATSADSLSAVCNPCITNSQIIDIDGAKVTGTVANATNVSGGTVSGSGAGLTNLNGANINAGSVTSAQLAPNVVQNNLALLGSLRWDVLRGQQNFAVGTTPRGIAFDGANMWITNLTGNNVTKLRASDGVNLGTFTVGSNPGGIAFDGANMWITNANLGGTIIKLRASDGVNLGTFPVGDNPRDIAVDGVNMWVANSGSDNVMKLRASDGTNLGTFPVGTFPVALAFDGANMWSVNQGSNNVTRLSPAFP